jgi:hypothetical protein
MAAKQKWQAHYRAENSEITALPMCNDQHPVKSLQRLIISMTSRVLAKSKEYMSKKILSLRWPPRNPTIASGATPIGSAGRAPNERKEEGERF